MPGHPHIIDTIESGMNIETELSNEAAGIGVFPSEGPLSFFSSMHFSEERSSSLMLTSL